MMRRSMFVHATAQYAVTFNINLMALAVSAICINKIYFENINVDLLSSILYSVENKGD